MTVTNKVTNSVAAHQSPTDFLKWYYSIRLIIGVVWLKLAFKSHTLVLYHWLLSRQNWIFWSFSLFLFYFRFAAISKQKLPDNNTNAAFYYMYNLQCNGTEDSVEDCSFIWALRTCSDKSAIHVSCSKCVYFLWIYIYTIGLRTSFCNLLVRLHTNTLIA